MAKTWEWQCGLVEVGPLHSSRWEIPSRTEKGKSNGSLQFLVQELRMEVKDPKLLTLKIIHDMLMKLLCSSASSKQ